MPIDIPTLPVLVKRGDADLEAVADGSLRRSDQKVLSRVHAGATYGLYGFLGYLSAQILPDTCDEDVLLRWAEMRNIPRTPAVSARGYVLMQGQSGAMAVLNGLLQAADGRQYRIAKETAIVDGWASVPIVAVLRGEAGNAVAGVSLSAVSPMPGVIDQAVVDDQGLTYGTDEESIQSWRARVVRSFRVIPHGGAHEDYETWAMEVPGVTRAWTVPTYMGPGTVGLFFVRDNDPDLIPSQESIAAVQSHIDLLRPVTSEVYVLAPEPKQIKYRISVDPNTDVVRARVEESLRDLHRRAGDLGGRLLWSHMGNAISTTPGENDHKLVEPAADVVLAANQLPVFGGIEWL